MGESVYLVIAFSLKFYTVPLSWCWKTFTEKQRFTMRRWAPLWQLCQSVPWQLFSTHRVCTLQLLFLFFIKDISQMKDIPGYKERSGPSLSAVQSLQQKPQKEVTMGCFVVCCDRESPVPMRGCRYAAYRSEPIYGLMYIYIVVHM